MKAHLAYLAENSKTIRAAGPLRNDVDGPPVGAVWIIDGTDRAEAEALYENDPFWLNGFRESVELHHWSKGFPAGEARLE